MEIDPLYADVVVGQVQSVHREEGPTWVGSRAMW